MNWLTWIKEDNAILAAMTGSYTGLGFNPFPTLDYNIVSGVVDPLITPFFATINVVLGMLISAAMLAILWFKNAWYASYLPIVSNRSFDRFGHAYNVTRILADGRLDVAAYEAYSPVYISAANAFIFGGYFALYPATLVYAYLYHGADILNAIQSLFGKGQAMHKDIHSRLMEAYKEVPGWWYVGVMLFGTGLALLMIGLYPTGMPIWGLAVSIVLGALFILPVGLIAAVSNVEIGLNVLSEMIAGLAMPGNPSGMMIFKAYGTLSLAQGLSFAADLKLGHYSKIPPRTLFAAQVIGTLLSVFMTVFVTNWQIDHLIGFCSPEQKQKFTCPGANTFFTSSIIWGVLGPRQSYGSHGLYRHLLWGALIGLVLPVPFYFAAKRYPRSIISKLHPPILLAGVISWAPINLSYITAAIPIAYLFHVQIKKRFYAWWAKYTYVIATGLSTGIAIAGLVAFVA
jgi:OPT family small oligopeptide transporter